MGGALPTRHNARVVGLVAGVATALIVTLPIGAAVGIVAGFATRRETWRPVFTLLPAALLAVAAGYVIVLRAGQRHPTGAALAEPDRTAPSLGLTAVVLLAVDVAIAHSGPTAATTADPDRPPPGRGLRQTAAHERTRLLVHGFATSFE